MPGCTTVPVSASFTLGPYTYTTHSGSLGFTNAALPGTNCMSSGFTQFSLHTIDAPATGTPWSLDSGGVLIISYRDLLVRDTFPNTPTASSAFVFYTSPTGGDTWTFTGSSSINALEQPTPVPEPGSLTLLAIGLAAAFRRARAIRG
jgi:hypothetical protein